MQQRLDLHEIQRVDPSRHGHFTLRFTREKIPAMAAAMCLVGHIVDDEPETYGRGELEV